MRRALAISLAILVVMSTTTAAMDEELSTWISDSMGSTKMSIPETRVPTRPLISPASRHLPGTRRDCYVHALKNGHPF